MESWKDPSVALGERCLLLARHEMAKGVKANPYGQPNTGPRVREYLEPCVRDLDDDGDVERLGLTQGNWCAAFASWCLEQCLLPGEEPPHLYRAGVVEIVADATERGLWHPVEEVRQGLWTPWKGDLAIWDRSDPSRPETAWWRHVNRLVRWVDGDFENFVTIGGNERRRIIETSENPKDLASSKLLGFVSYWQRPTVIEMTDEERARNFRLIASFVEQHRRELA